MGKKLIKGKKGASSMFISRARAVRKLSLPIKDFRKLCIYKGVFPRVPPNKLKSTHKTYYHLKDINFLAQDRLAEHFRTVGALRKKLKTAVVAKDTKTAARLKARMPRLNLDRVVKERYPAFDLALNDLDDPLSLVALVASVATHRLFKLSPLRVALSARLLRYFKAFVAGKGLLRRVFLSTKGVYYQAEVKQTPITWLEPYAFTAVLPFDVDYKVLLSFLEFYLVLLKFVVFKLYSSAQLAYPPLEAAQPGRAEAENVFCGLQLRGVEPAEQGGVDPEFAAQIAERNARASKPLFKGFVFFLSREVDRGIFEFLIASFGGKALWDLANFDSELYRMEGITHVVLDRPLGGLEGHPGREYVQPQWICDCINFGALLPVGEYLPGRPLPPHLSPFVRDEEEGYVPQRKQQVLQLLGEYVEEAVDEDEGTEEPLSEQPAFISRPEPMVVVRGATQTSRTDTHGLFSAAPSPAYKVTRTHYSAEEERRQQEAELRAAQRETAHNQALSLNRKRRRLLGKISAAEAAKRERAQELARRAKVLQY